jgi:hypothetical protein
LDVVGARCLDMAQPTSPEATRIPSGYRLRALLVVAASLLVVGAGVLGRFDSARRPVPAAAATAVPVPSAMVVAVDPPTSVATAGNGEDGLIGGRVPRLPAGPPEPASPPTDGTVCVLLHVDPAMTLVGQVERGPLGVYQGSIPLPVPRRTVGATLELYPPQRHSAVQARPAAQEPSIARFTVTIDARPFPPGSLRILSEPVPMHADAPDAIPLVRDGFTVYGTLHSDGRAVELTIVIAPRPVATPTPRDLGAGAGTFEIRTALQPVPSGGC